eukprot:12056608-Alexandrium_andersonii.AAC.1
MPEAHAQAACIRPECGPRARRGSESVGELGDEGSRSQRQLFSKSLCPQESLLLHGNGPGGPSSWSYVWVQ